ncbi:MAG: YicC/YloC family endoribonuclease, partial [Candidatus Oleimmundimicrobium sp.]|nr:YicC/YloC family endoribonuclease [Candidatus Oleimmundimicrobium sp.]
MLQSMTGYGEAVYEADGFYYCAQIRTVNNKFLKVSLKLPENVNFLEETIEKQLRQGITRGSVYFSLQLKSAAEKPLATINTGIVKYYVEQLNNAVADCPDKCTINLTNLLSFPGVVESYSPDERQKELLEKAVFKVTTDALGSLRKMRQAEGEELQADLLSHCKVIEEVLGNISDRAPVIVSEYYEKLQKRVNDML